MIFEKLEKLINFTPKDLYKKGFYCSGTDGEKSYSNNDYVFFMKDLDKCKEFEKLNLKRAYDICVSDCSYVNLKLSIEKGESIKDSNGDWKEIELIYVEVSLSDEGSDSTIIFKGYIFSKEDLLILLQILKLK